MLQAANTDIFNPLLLKSHNIECQIPLQIDLFNPYFPKAHNSKCQIHFTN